MQEDKKKIIFFMPAMEGGGVEKKFDINLKLYL